MPRTARASVGNVCYHVINRGNGKARVFHNNGDYAAFNALFDEASARLSMRLLAYCLMPNHFHLVLWPRGDGDLSRWMQWLMTAHVRRYHRLRGTSGHVWQGRFKAFPIQKDEHLVTVLGYVECNPLRAGLVERAEEWAWSSLRMRQGRDPETVLDKGPAPLPRNWTGFVNRPQTGTELDHVRRCVNREAPFGNVDWARNTARRLGLESSLRPLGRPPKRRRQPGKRRPG